MDRQKTIKAVEDLLDALGADRNSEGLRDTPRRVADAYAELLSGENQTAEEHLLKTFTAASGEMVIERDIFFSSTCEHHLMPFFWIAHIAYIPNKKIIGLSKIARVVEKYSKKLQVQERMTEEIIEKKKKNLGTDNIAVYIEAKHMCMISRGVKKELTSTVTTKFSGSFKNERKSEFLFLLGKGN